MRRNARFWLCLTLATLAGISMPMAAASQTAPPAIVEIGELGQSVNVQLRAGDTLRIVLPATPSTGYSWRAAGDDTAGAVQIKESRYQTGRPMPGAAGTETFTLLAKTSGEDHLALTYARPWEKQAKPARSYVVNITVHAAGSGADLPSVLPAGMMIGVYSGKTLCADCSGIVTTVALYATSSDQMTDTYYVRTMKYLGAPKGDTTFVSAGNWSLKTGTPVNAQAIVYSLESNTSDHVDAYQRTGETLEVIGKDGKPAQNPYNSNLQKQ